MRRLPRDERDAAIAAAGNVIDARLQFEHREKQATLSRSYRKPQQPKGPA